MRRGARERRSRVNFIGSGRAKHVVTEVRLFFSTCTFTLQAIVILNKQETYGITDKKQRHCGGT